MRLPPASRMGILRRRVHAIRSAADHGQLLICHHPAQPRRHFYRIFRDDSTARHGDAVCFQQLQVPLGKEKMGFVFPEDMQRIRPIRAFANQTAIPLLLVSLNLFKNPRRSGQQQPRTKQRFLRNGCGLSQHESVKRTVFQSNVCKAARVNGLGRELSHAIYVSRHSRAHSSSE